MAWRVGCFRMGKGEQTMVIARTLCHSSQTASGVAKARSGSKTLPVSARLSLGTYSSQETNAVSIHILLKVKHVHAV